MPCDLSYSKFCFITIGITVVAFFLCPAVFPQIELQLVEKPVAAVDSSPSPAPSMPKDVDSLVLLAPGPDPATKTSLACPAHRGVGPLQGFWPKKVKANCPHMGKVGHFISIDGDTNVCNLEDDMHRLVSVHLPPSSTVLEFGGRRGTTSCAISHALHHSGKLVVAEPEPNIWDRLEGNRDANGCNYMTLHGIVANQPAYLERQGYGTKTHAIPPGGAESASGSHVRVQNYRLADIETGCGLKFDTLVADCEGCMIAFFEQNREFFATQLKWLFFEKDGPFSWDSTIRELKLLGFEQLEVVEDKIFKNLKMTEEVWRHRKRAVAP